MSGHSHYATIKRQKAVNDAAKGRVFSRHSKAIAIAIKEGGSADPEMNSRLRFAIDQAKADNMPKANIDRILQRAAESGDIYEAVYEGYGPEGISIIVEVATNNKNRTAQEIKNLFEKGGGNLGGPGSVSFNFEKKGLIQIKKQPDYETQMLSLIDLGVEDVDEDDDIIEAYTDPTKLAEVKEKINEAGHQVTSFSLIMKPKVLSPMTLLDKARKALNLLNTLEEHDDVLNVFTNLDIPQEIMTQLES